MSNTSSSSTPLSKNEEELLRVSERLNLATKSARIRVWDYNIDENFLWWDESMYELYEVSRADFTPSYEGWSSFLHPEDKPRVLENLTNALKGIGEYDTEFRIQLRNGSLRYIKANATVKRDSHGNAQRMVGVNIDISQLKETENKLIIAKELAEKADRAKSEFLAVMSHEIRTPMNGIMGFTSLLKNELTDPQQIDYLKTIETSGENLLNLINDILDLSKIEAGGIELESHPTELSRFIQETCLPHEIKAREKKIDLKIKIDPQLPSFILIDPTRFRQIIHNLVGNALKFTDQGSVSIEISHETSKAITPNSFMLQIQIQDTGIGISQEALQKLFKPFSQADSTTTRRYGGTGLGLVITKRLCELMNGSIKVQSQIDQGSLFICTVQTKEYIPKITPPTPPQDPTWKKSGKTLKILAAEDNEINQKLLARILNPLGHQVTFAHDGLEAIELWKSNSFDLILMDLQMPHLNGLEATQQIRIIEKSTSKERIRIIAITANAMKEDVEKCYAAGMDAYISKPIQVKKLIENLQPSLGH
jgi:signal transduction histidine kinase/ActR/RegA family two-component response regulator